MLVDEIAALLVSQGIALAGSTANWVVAKQYEPATPDRVFTVVETGGFPNEGLSTGTVDRPTFQLRCRGPVANPGVASASTARVKIELARAALEAQLNTNLSGWRYLHIKANHPPIYLGRDNTMRDTLVMNFTALRSRTS
jgi:Bacteriophage minor capsid protein